MIFLYILLILICIYIVFIVLPGILSTFYIFKAKDDLKTIDTIQSFNGLYPYLDTLYKDKEFLDSKNSQDVYIKSFDNLNLHGTYFDNNSDKTIIFVHGYITDPFMSFYSQAKFFYNNNFNLLFVTQRAHIPSEGKYMSFGVHEGKDVSMWVDWCKNNTNTKNALLYGVSMGAASIAFSTPSCDSDFVKGVIFDCGFYSPYEAVRHETIKRKLPAFLLMPIICITAKIIIHFDMKENVSNSLNNSNLKILFIHGKADNTVPVSQGRKIYRECKLEKKQILVDNAAHITSYNADKEHIEYEISNYFKEMF